MKKVIVITGASSGFGALTARALARSGPHGLRRHARDDGRNAPQVEQAQAFSKEHGVDLRSVELDVQSDSRRSTRPSRRSSRSTAASTS